MVQILEKEKEIVLDEIIYQDTPIRSMNGKNASADPYQYGWRYVKRIDSQGEAFVKQPLTLEDILHPQEEDFQMQHSQHSSIIEYVNSACKKQLKNDSSTVVLSDVRVAWKKIKYAHGPDIAVIFGVDESKKKEGWGTFDEKIEGTKPCLIIEVTSPETRQIDLGDKRREYAEAGVEYYIIIDRHRGVRLLGYELIKGNYVPLKPDDRGRLWLAPVEMWLAVGPDDRIECYDQQGKIILNDVDEHNARQEAEWVAQAETLARAKIEAELRELKAKYEMNLLKKGS